MPRSDRTNVVVITCHDIGDFLACYGVPVATPNLDRLADEGIVFENHFSTSTVCSPGRGALMTGCYPHTNGLMGLVHRGWKLDTDRTPHLAALLGGAGYDTAVFGGQHEHWDPRLLGYAEIPAEGTHHGEDIARRFADWIASRKDASRPFFANICFGEGHRVGMNPSHFRRDIYEPADPASVDVPPWLPDIPEIREDLAWFYGALGYIDTQVGRLLDAIEHAGMALSTVVVFTADHGASFIHGKATLYDGGTKVAMLARHSGSLPAGRRVSNLTSHVDLVATLFEHLGLEAPGHVEGRSQLGLIRGDTSAEPRSCVFAERNYTNFFDPARMARSLRYKYIRKGLRTCVFDFQIPEIELSPWDWRRNRAVFDFYSAERVTDELYDLQSDPGELRNLAADPAHADALAGMRRALDEHMERTDDPFRRQSIELLMPVELLAAVKGRSS